MVDGKNLSSQSVKYLSDLSYESMVMIYDTHCNKCPFSLIELQKGNRIYEQFESIEDGIQKLLHLTDPAFEYKLSRGCQFSGIRLTLREIVTNTCKFWKIETSEGGQNELEPCFIEIQKVEEVDVKHTI